MTSAISNAEIDISGYNIQTRDRGSKGGGIDVYTSVDLSVLRRADLELDSIESVWLEVTLPKSRNFLIRTYYKSPDSSNYHNASFLSYFKDTLEIVTSQGFEMVLLGDYNLDFSARRPDQRECK